MRSLACPKFCLKCKKGGQQKSSATPLPLRKVLVVLLVQFGHVFGSIVLFPFLPFMVHDFFPELNKEELGRKAGYLGSAYFIGSFAGSMMWGWISDTWGRRPALLTGCIGTIFSSLLFGFSQNFGTAVFARLLWGFLNGNVGVAKTYLSEVLDDSNQAKGFSIFGVAAGVARLVGSVVGGFLSQPASKYTLFQNSFFCKFRYILPIFVNVAISLFGFIAAILFMEETLRKKSSSKVDPSPEDTDTSSIDSNATDIELIPLTENTSNNDETTTNTITASTDFNTTDTDLNTTDTDPTTSNADINTAADINKTNDVLLRHDLAFTIQHEPLSERPNSFLSKLKNIDWLYPLKSQYRMQKEQLILCCICFVDWHKGNALQMPSPKQILKNILARIMLMLKLMMDRRVIVSVLCYGLTGGLMVMSNEIIPLLLVTDHQHGGYNMDDNEIAVFVMISGAFILLFQVILYPRVVKFTGYRNMFRITLVLFCASIILLPWSNSITGPISTDSVHGSGSGTGPDYTVGYCGYNMSRESVNEDSVTRLPVSVWLILLVTFTAMIVAKSISTVTTVVMVNNSTLKTTKGTVNGLGQSMVAIFRAIGPSFGALVFAWSQGNGLGWPLNYHLMFELSALFGIGIMIFTLCLPKSIEKKRQAN